MRAVSRVVLFGYVLMYHKSYSDTMLSVHKKNQKTLLEYTLNGLPYLSLGAWMSVT